MREYDEYVKPIMDELNQKFKLLTKINDNCWLIQSKESSLMEAFFVHTTDNCHIIMSGDYDGIMVRPYGNADALPNWMAGATTLSYFAEKVGSANRYHKRKEYSKDKAKENIEEIKKSFLEGIEDDDELIKKTREFDDVVGCDSLEMEHEYWTLISRLEHEFGLYDLCEYNPLEYTNQIKWQHKCLVFWANKVLDGAFKDKAKQTSAKQEGVDNKLVSGCCGESVYTNQSKYWYCSGCDKVCTPRPKE